MGQLTCQWIYLAAHDDKIEGACGALVDGDSGYCEEHQREINLIHSLDDDWNETEASRKAGGKQPKEDKGRKQ